MTQLIRWPNALPANLFPLRWERSMHAYYELLFSGRTYDAPNHNSSQPHMMEFIACLHAIFLMIPVIHTNICSINESIKMNFSLLFAVCVILWLSL